MPSFCAVLGCSDKYGHGQNVSFHKFPTKNKELLEKWISFTQRPNDWRPSKWMSICGLHFQDEDYRCLEQKKLLKKNAIPSIRSSQTPEATEVENTKQITLENENGSVASNVKETIISKDKAKVNCRFCGIAAINFVSFSGNFEIFGMIQKCLPTLSICQDDNLPKELCVNCLKRLENFARFIDKVLETQETLLRQFRNEKGATKTNERILKIKQEPQIRVKQENDDDLSAFFPDEVDDGCCVDQDNDVSNTDSQLDQKFQFCDFPVLNDQDIINNCDIMEIINLSDPFIDITNCENTIAEEEQQQQHQQQHQHQHQHDISNKHDTSLSQTPRHQSQFTAHELLLSHMLLEEHNYAYAAEDFKEEWQIKHCYKTEKVEAEDYEPDISIDQTMNDDTGQDLNDQFINDSEVAATETVKTTLSATTTIFDNHVERSNKPIVTSISAINETSIVPLTQVCTTNIVSEKPPLSRKKPNIVVLNESIVQSSHTLQLQACTICQLKFFSLDSLNQHYSTAHNAQSTNYAPMVSLPASNISTWNNNFYQESSKQYQSYKVEKDVSVDNTNPEVTILESSSTRQIESESESHVPKRSSKNEIKILDMQQSFLQHQYFYGYHPQQGLTVSSNTQQFPNTTETFTSIPQVQTNVYETETTEQLRKKPSSQSTRNTYFPDEYVNNMLPNTTSKNLSEQETFAVLSNGRNLERITADYIALKKRYHRLQLKCRSLSNGNPKRRHNKKLAHCRICGSEFDTIFQLIRHKQSLISHHIRKPHSRFFRSCIGCEKFFCHKIALQNHMRFICQSLPLRWLKIPIRTFKCRYCSRITFTHWRLYRRHEVYCRRKKINPSKISKLNSQRTFNFATNYFPPAQSHSIDNFSIPKRLPLSQAKASTPKRPRINKISNKSQSHVCSECKKVFSTASSLTQHRITHTELRVHQCKICQRVFKRRNGLSQHVRGFHMKVKPFECPMCKHCYALKSDMRRCKHSSLGRRGSKTVKKKNAT